MTDDFFDEDDMTMACGHKGIHWSSEWKKCMICGATFGEQMDRMHKVFKAARDARNVNSPNGIKGFQERSSENR